MKLGHIKRAKPHMIVLAGYSPNETMTRKASYPVGLDSAGNPITIKSGQVISPVYSNERARFEWQLGGIPGQEAYFADADSTDADVVSADSLPGLSCSGQYELQTGYFANSLTAYDADETYLTFATGADAGKVKPGTLGTDTIIGIVSRYKDQPISLAGVNSEASDLNVVTLRTIFIPPQP